MDIETLNKRENPLLDRTEVNFLVHHPGEATPKRDAVRDAVAKATGNNTASTIIDSLESDYGRAVSRGFAKCYGSVEAAMANERNHLLKRNGLITKGADE